MTETADSNVADNVVRSGQHGVQKVEIAEAERPLLLIIFDSSQHFAAVPQKIAMQHMGQVSHS